MHTDGQTATYGRRETTLIGYAPAPPAPRAVIESDLAPTAPAVFAPSEGQASEIAAQAAENLAANLAGALGEPGDPDRLPPTTHLHPASAADALARPVALDEVAPSAGSDRRNPLSRRLPINRGRHLSRAFFEEGERQELIGWEHSALVVDPTLAASERPGFTSFDRVPRKRAPMIALAVVGATAILVAGTWANSRRSPRGPQSRDVWSALQVPGAGWQPPAPVKTAFSPTVDAPPAVRPSRPTVSSAPAAPAPAPAPVAVKANAAPPITAARPQAVKSSPPATVAVAVTTTAAPARPRAQVPRVVVPPPAASRRHPAVARRPPARTAPARSVPVRARAKSPPAPAVVEAATGAPAPAAAASADESAPVAAAAPAAPAPAAAAVAPAATAVPAPAVAPVELPPASTAPAAAPAAEPAADAP